MANDVYTSPLASRYASPYMLHLFSPDSRFQTWRRLWVALARAQHQLGLPITARQVQELEAHVTDIDYEVAAAREREVRHDVMAHVYAYGKAAPSAAGILHLGATSCYVTDNADLILYRDGLRYLRGQLLSVLADLATYFVTSLQLGAAFPDPQSGFAGSSLKFMGIFCLTQIPIAIAEGLLTVMIYDQLTKRQLIPARGH